MAVNFPTSLDILQNPTATDYLNSPSHAGQHANANDILEALEAKVGINSSAVTTSHDYKLSNIIGSQKAASEDYVNNNRKIVPSVSGNNLTVALKTLAGNDPSVSDPAYIRIGDIIRIITYPVSFTVNAGQNYLNMGSSELATKTVGLFPKLVWNTNTGAVSLIVSRIPFGNLISEYTDSLTGEKGYLYSGTKPASTDLVENVGYFEATLSAGAGHTWTVPTFTSENLRQVPTFEAREITTATGKRIYVSGRTVRINAFIFQTSNGSVGLQTVKAFAYPITFSAAPSVLASYTGWKNGSDFVNFGEGGGGEFASVFAIDKTTSSCNIFFKSDTALSSAYRYGAHMEIFGTW